MASGRLIDYLGEGLLADRPTTPDLHTGTLGLYFATDTTTLYAWDGTTWNTITSGGGGGSGDVTGPVSSANNSLVLFDGTSGKIIKDAGQTIATVTAAARAPNVQSVTSSATVTPTFSNDLVAITAQAANLTLANPSGTSVDGWGIVIRLKDNGTSRTITYGSQYRAVGVTLPTATVAGKVVYIAGIWNASETTFDVLATGQLA